MYSSVAFFFYCCTYGQSLSNSDFFVTKDSSDVSVSTCSGRAHAASSSWPHSSVLTCTQKTEIKFCWKKKMENY